MVTTRKINIKKFDKLTCIRIQHDKIIKYNKIIEFAEIR